MIELRGVSLLVAIVWSYTLTQLGLLKFILILRVVRFRLLVRGTHTLIVKNIDLVVAVEVQ